MKVFGTFETIFGFFAVRPELAQTWRQKWMNTLTIPFINLILAEGSILLLIYLITDAATFQEFSETVYGLVTLVTVIFGLTIYYSNSEQMFKLNDDFQSAIEMRKYFTNFTLFYNFDSQIYKWFLYEQQL